MLGVKPAPVYRPALSGRRRPLTHTSTRYRCLPVLTSSLLLVTANTGVDAFARRATSSEKSSEVPVGEREGMIRRRVVSSVARTASEEDLVKQVEQVLKMVVRLREQDNKTKMLREECDRRIAAICKKLGILQRPPEDTVDDTAPFPRFRGNVTLSSECPKE